MTGHGDAKAKAKGLPLTGLAAAARRLYVRILRSTELRLPLSRPCSAWEDSASYSVHFYCSVPPYGELNSSAGLGSRPTSSQVSPAIAIGAIPGCGGHTFAARQATHLAIIATLQGRPLANRPSVTQRRLDSLRVLVTAACTT
ncbi:hypothetical protein TEQG_07048 [Trichophyton equinum CBS 127.97]|uniref:Uncharacterized protein n=1 Tax=Trichophyton equinum (strain ATCC MYA-4606 / CBS 127.97) TaxID=559882 RepID=F2Q1G0_TRIEC|nr:hypothetical protein TEQG_07048 [Trichophyton equinum CBS 127.97]